ncbi:VOC family protein [Nocardia jiangxiensis]|uniref:VOC family protein n=1 Tax=Nocardia jiangxiensis TaxID=282685 RepID=UPI0006844C7A|nr:VOC family protein [Nocardia jiangxiensis]
MIGRIELRKSAIDLAIVTAMPERMTWFYRDVLGLEDLGVAATRSTPGGSVRRLLCGNSVIKLISYADDPPLRAPQGNVTDATGFRYLTIFVGNLLEVVGACERADIRVVTPVKEVSTGVRIAIVEDPEGNLVEFLEGRG